MTMTMTTTMTNTGLQLWRFPPCPAMFLFSHKVLPVLSFDFTWNPSFFPSLSTDFADLHVRKTLKLLLEVTFSFSLSFSTGLPRGRTLNWIGWNILRSTVMCTEKMGTSFFRCQYVMIYYILLLIWDSVMMEIVLSDPPMTTQDYIQYIPLDKLWVNNKKSFITIYIFYRLEQSFHFEPT